MYPLYPYTLFLPARNMQIHGRLTLHVAIYLFVYEQTLHEQNDARRA